MRKTDQSPFCAMISKIVECELVIQNTEQNPAHYTALHLTPEGMRAYMERERGKIRTALEEEHAKGPMTKEAIRQLLKMAQRSPILSVLHEVGVQLQWAVKPLPDEEKELFEGRRAEVECLFVQFSQSRESVTDDLVGTFHQHIVGGLSHA